MDVATRFQARARAGSLFDRDGNFIGVGASAADGVSPSNSPLHHAQRGLTTARLADSSPARRKPHRTATDPAPPSPPDGPSFRKPSMPASAARAPPTLEHRLPVSSEQKRRSTLHRENVRVPSGPRDFPSPGKQRKVSANSATTASIGDTTNTNIARPPLTSSTSDSIYYDARTAPTLPHLGFTNPATTKDSLDYSSTSTTTPSTDEGGAFLPDLNFDDLQTGIKTTNIKNYAANGPPLLGDLNGWAAERPKAEAYERITRSGGLAAKSDARPEQVPRGEISRTSSLRQRLATGRLPPATQQRPGIASSQPKDETLKLRRQTSVSRSPGPQGPLPALPSYRQPRKSMGPGAITGVSKSSGIQPAPPPSTTTASLTADPHLKPTPTLSRNASLTRGSRRTAVQPAPSTVTTDLPRAATLSTAATQSRQTKGRSLQPPPPEPVDATSTPSGTKSSSKPHQNRSNTPSSSANKRQSTAQNRAPSGLGARTISPTDARRLKRMSMMNPPPMPSSAQRRRPTPNPQEDMPVPVAADARVPELPRLTQPSPSLIPRRTSDRRTSSTRASPEARPGGVTLSSKSSFSSLLNAAQSGSSSKLPTPKMKLGALSGSAMGHHRDQYSDGQEAYSGYSGGEELVPPVPAIPKAYESPKDLEVEPPFFTSFNPSQYRTSDSSLIDPQLATTSVPSPWTTRTPRSSIDVPSEPPQKRSREFSRANSGGNSAAAPSSAASKPIRQQPDSNGRKNANLQPLRLPPLNLMPISTKASYSDGLLGMSRPSQEDDRREDFANFSTPEPKRTAKTPSTPMTASKATFFRRQEDANKALRSSSSHHALRDVLGRDILGMDTDGNMLTKYWDDSDTENTGVPINGSGARGRNAITPFSSGSLPQGSGEYVRLKARPSGEGIGEDSDGQQSTTQALRVRPQRGATVTSLKSSLSAETPVSLDSPVAESTARSDGKESDKKEQGLRRKLSMGWRRSSSKSANHADNKTSPQKERQSVERERERNVLQKKRPSDVMPPPKLPPSVTGAFTGDVSSLASSARPSFEGMVRRKSQVPASASTTSLTSGIDLDSTAGTGSKTRSLHGEQPTPVHAPTTTRASSWGALGSAFRSSTPKAAPTSRHRPTPSTVSATNKDKDDLAADDEMARLSRKRKDVDSAARETEELKKRALARSPNTTEQVLHDRSLTGGSALNVFERGEIVDYEQDGIYFTGSKSARKIIGSLAASPQPSAASTISDKNNTSGTNFGYDDERGDYNIVIGDHLAYRYEVVDVLGKGSFGQVVRCVDHKEGGIVAVKIIRNKKRFHQQALVEVGILGKLREWDPDGAHATLSITGSFYFRSHLCIVTPCLSINLYELIRAHNFAGFSMPVIRRIARQLLACLTLLQTKRIIHCDLKPENILLFEARKADVRVIDFGSSCREEEKVYTYIQSRFYRSPEVILGSSYGLGIDMWSFGCILAELWTGYPIFPGENEQEQLACIMEIFGPPDRHLVEKCTRKKLFFDSVGKPRVTVSSKGRRRRPSSKTLQQALKTEDEAFIDFITRCLRWDPDRRLKASEAVTHPFITNSPFNQRSTLPDEARRAAKLRSTAAVPAGNVSTIPSPVKRSTVASLNAPATITPAKDRARGILETPQTAVRNSTQTSASTNLTQGSPVKLAANANRRHSTITTAGAAVMAGGKRASNGVLAGGSTGVGTNAGPPPQRSTTGNIAQLAARESMGVAGNAAQSSASRWRT